MIRRLLIANRGEIAVRIISTCRKMGITAIAIYSEVDRGARHVSLADEAHCIGAAQAGASYLDGDKLISLARRVSADAIHPGYGFLAENADFAAACVCAGIIFVGPSADHIALMGSKIESKRLARDCGVPTVPGYSGEQQDAPSLRAAAEKIGTPLLIKASAGGGGRGMRMVRDMADFDVQLDLAVREAVTAFADPAILLEKYIAEPRHLEVQVLADHHGNLVHLFERECSIQRNYQKVIEEAPAAFLQEPVRRSLYEYALDLCNHIKYRCAGTVEFLLDDTAGELYFLEMNTRLQVEHPVTEMITGLDLVEWQIRIACGEPLAFAQSDLAPRGWALEARVTAEDPADNYRPQTGRVEFYREPAGEGIRVDSGIVEGAEVSSYYDSLLAKVIASGDTREQARNRLSEALGDFLLAGTGNNIAFLRDLLGHPAFLSRSLTTHYIERQFPQGWQSADPGGASLLVAAALAWNGHRGRAGCDQQSPWQRLGGWRLLENAGHRPRQRLSLRDASGHIHLLEFFTSTNGYEFTIEGEVFDVGMPRYSGRELAVEIDGAFRRYLVEVDEQRVFLSQGTVSQSLEVVPQRVALAGKGDTELTGEQWLKSPMPGLIERINVGIGERVKPGDVLVTMEAMKLMHNLTSSACGTVVAIHCNEGQNVAADTLLLEISTDEK